MIEGSEKMLFVNVTGEGVPEKIIYASIFDPTILINDQKPEVLHSQKNRLLKIPTARLQQLPE